MSGFVDLLRELLAMAEENKHLSPHKIARKFVLDIGTKHGGVEVIVVTDKHGKFVAAGTQKLPAAVDFPPGLHEQLQDPNAGLVIHHNHPPAEEPFFSGTDMHGLANNRGIGWLLMHTDDSFMAMRATDKMFVPDAAGEKLADNLPKAYETGQRFAQFSIFRSGVDPNQELAESVAPDIALRALSHVGAIQYHSSLKPELDHELEQNIIRHMRTECIANPEQSGGAAIWSG